MIPFEFRSGITPKINFYPWNRTYRVADDFLEKFYYYKINNQNYYLVSNNLNYKDRVFLDSVYKYYRKHIVFGTIAAFYSSWIFSYFDKTNVRYINYLKFAALGIAFEIAVFKYLKYKFTPIFSYFYSKYQNSVKSDIYQIKDPSREWFDIDTSEYTSYPLEKVEDITKENFSSIPVFLIRIFIITKIVGLKN